MNSMQNLVEIIKADVNAEESQIVSSFEKITSRLFISFIAISVPLFLYLLFAH
ncbi:hypothetical protein [Bacillus sp. B1-b2]|uniref:hypothetical protein n=1 Tax=Bacillus sp. B1-b2 TaxID=2653201 RepID=UPI001869EBDE|nr:hypothetical protein [Bacillus sp. B1-b2]